LLPDSEEGGVIQLLRAGQELALKGCLRALEVATDGTPISWTLLAVAVICSAIVMGGVGFGIGILFERRKLKVNISFWFLKQS